MFRIGAVDIDVAAVGVCVFGIFAFKPEDARLDVVCFVIGGAKASGGLATDEDLALWSALAPL